MRFMSPRHVLFHAAIVALISIQGAGAEAGIIVFDLETQINGTSSPPPPGVTATFQDTGPNTVKMTLSNNMPAAQFVDTWLFNVTGNASLLTASFVSGNTAAVTLHAAQDISGGNNMKAGLFNVDFEWPTSNSDVNRFNGGETTVYNFTRTGLTASSFEVFSINKPNPNGSAGGWYSAAHVQGFANAASESIGTNTVTPEPGSLTLACLGLASIGGIFLKRKRFGQLTAA